MARQVSKVSLIDIQFSDKYDGHKARRLAQELHRLQQKLNEIIGAFSGLDDETLQHVLATTESIGPQHSVSGLSSGMVLKAIAADDAAFAYLNLGDLGNVNTTGAEEGDTLQFIGSQWQPVRDMGFNSLGDPGQFALVYWNEITDTLGWSTLGSTLTITNDGILSVVASAIDHGSLFGLADDDHGAVYPGFAQSETISGDWLFTGVFGLAGSSISPYMLETDASADEGLWDEFIDAGIRSYRTRTDLDGDGETYQRLTRSGTEITEILWSATSLVYERAEELNLTWRITGAETDENGFGVAVVPGMFQLVTRLDDGTAGEVWLSVTSDGGTSDEINLSANSLTFNGYDIRTRDGIVMERDVIAAQVFS